MSDGPARRVSASRISRAISFGLGSGTMLQPLNSSMIAVAIIGIANHFGTMRGTSWVISGLYVATAVAAPMAGSLGSIFGPRRVYLSGLVLIMAGAVLGGLAPSLGWLIVARVMLGLGTASQYPAAITIVRYVADRERAQVSSGIAVLSICAQSMVAVGPTLGGLLVGLFGWQSIMWVNVPMVLITAVWVWRAVPNVPPTRERSGSVLRDLDLPGAALFTATIAGLMFLLLSLDGQPLWWLMPIVIVCAVALAWWELRCRTPFFDVRLLIANRALTLTLGRTLLTYLAFYCVFFGLPQWLQDGRGVSALQAGLLMLPLAIVGMGMTMMANRVYLARGAKLCLAIGSAALCLGGLAISLLDRSSAPVVVLLLVAALLGVPNAFNNMGNQNVINAVTTTDQIGPALGSYRTIQYVGANLAAIVIELMMGGRASDAGLHRIGYVIAGIAALLFVGVLISRHLPDRRGPEQKAARQGHQRLPSSAS